MKGTAEELTTPNKTGESTKTARTPVWKMAKAVEEPAAEKREPAPDATVADQLRDLILLARSQEATIRRLETALAARGAPTPPGGGAPEAAAPGAPAPPLMTAAPEAPTLPPAKDEPDAPEGAGGRDPPHPSQTRALGMFPHYPHDDDGASSISSLNSTGTCAIDFRVGQPTAASPDNPRHAALLREMLGQTVLRLSLTGNDDDSEEEGDRRLPDMADALRLLRIRLNYKDPATTVGLLIATPWGTLSSMLSVDWEGKRKDGRALTRESYSGTPSP